MAGRNPTPETIAAIRHEFGLDRPLPVQYVLVMKHLRRHARPRVVHQPRRRGRARDRARRRPVTLSLDHRRGGASGWSRASIIGVAAAVLRGTLWDPLLMALALLGISIPVFWLGQVANLVTQDRWHDTFLFSLGAAARLHAAHRGPGDVVQAPRDPVDHARAALHRASTPASCARRWSRRRARTSCAPRARRASPSGACSCRHQLRISMITFVSLFGLDFGALVGGGALLTEVVFGLPGVGRLTYHVARRPRPAGDHGHRPLRRVLHRDRQRARRHPLRAAGPAHPRAGDG